MQDKLIKYNGTQIKFEPLKKEKIANEKRFY